MQNQEKNKNTSPRKNPNNVYAIPGTSRLVSIREAAYYFVGDVLSDIVGGRAKVKDVVDDVNENFLAHNPKGWDTTNTQKARESDGGFTVYGLRFLGRAAPPAKPERWAVQPTFYLDDDELVLLGDDEEMAEGSEQAESEQEAAEQEISDIDE